MESPVEIDKVNIQTKADINISGLVVKNTCESKEVIIDIPSDSDNSKDDAEGSSLESEENVGMEEKCDTISKTSLNKKTNLVQNSKQDNEGLLHINRGLLSMINNCIEKNKFPNKDRGFSITMGDLNRTNPTKSNLPNSLSAEEIRKDSDKITGSILNNAIANSITSSNLFKNITGAHSNISLSDLQLVYSQGLVKNLTQVSQQNIGRHNVVNTSSLEVSVPNITDDMFVLEAPSLVTSYIYEKPPERSLREYVDGLKQEVLLNEPAVLLSDDDSISSTQYLELMAGNRSSQQSKKYGVSIGSENYATTKDCFDSEEYFSKPLGIFFMSVGMNLVQEHVQKDLLRQQKKKFEREKKNASCNLRQTEKIVTSLTKSIEKISKKNSHLKHKLKKCNLCSFQSESSLAIAYHNEEPHMKNNLYKCNFCPVEIKSSHDITNHVIFQHGTKCRVEKPALTYQCDNCLFEDRFKAKLARHGNVCAKRFKPDINLIPPMDWEPPGKLRSVTKAPSYEQVKVDRTLCYKNNTNTFPMSQTKNNECPVPPNIQHFNNGYTKDILSINKFQESKMKDEWLILPNGLKLQGVEATVVGSNSYIQSITNSSQFNPSISITPLPCSTSISIHPTDSRSKLVKCEICDGYIKDLELLRNHMMWIHKLKIHPKTIYYKPPLNCQKCHSRFFTDQGLERHLLGAHSLVTDSMQIAANKGTDSGKCPVCGKIYQMKLVSHVARDHNTTLRPAHLTYKCTVCSETFGMYKQFEKHVYIEHSVLARRVTEKSNHEAVATKN